MSRDDRGGFYNTKTPGAEAPGVLVTKSSERCLAADGDAPLSNRPVLSLMSPAVRSGRSPDP